MEWGEAIAVNGMRPEWLRDDEVVRWSHHKSNGQVDAATLEWAGQHGYDNAVKVIRLPADHPYYTVQAHNAKHGTNFAYWPGGDEGPLDVESGCYFLMRGGQTFSSAYIPARGWRHRGMAGDIIGYQLKTVVGSDYVQVKRITESEADKLLRDHDYDIVKVLDSLGIIRPCTREERFTQETGITVTPDVSAALEWSKEND